MICGTRQPVAGVPLALVSKTLRHAALGITADLYGHLFRTTEVSAVKR